MLGKSFVVAPFLADPPLTSRVASTPSPSSSAGTRPRIRSHSGPSITGGRSTTTWAHDHVCPDWRRPALDPGTVQRVDDQPAVQHLLRGRCRPTPADSRSSTGLRAMYESDAPHAASSATISAHNSALSFTPSTSGRWPSHWGAFRPFQIQGELYNCRAPWRTSRAWLPTFRQTWIHDPEYGNRCAAIATRRSTRATLVN